MKIKQAMIFWLSEVDIYVKKIYDLCLLPLSKNFTAQTKSNNFFTHISTPLVLPTLFISLLLPTPLISVTTTLWENSEYNDFEGGKLANVSLDEHGIIRPTRPIEKVGKFQCDSIIAMTKLGSEYFIATIGPNGIFKFFPDKKEKNTTKFFTTKDEIITDLVTFNSKLYFSTLPQGNLYEIANGKTNKIASVPAKFLWKLYPSKEVLYITTGEPGAIFELDKKHKLTKLYSQEKMHFKPVIEYKDLLYFGGSPKSILYTLDSRKKVSVVRDFGHAEIADISFCDSNLYVLTNDFKDQPPEAGPVQNQPKTDKTQNTFDSFSLYEFDHDTIKKIFMEKNAMGTDLVCHEKMLSITSNPDGKIYSYSIKDDVMALAYDLTDEFIFSINFFDADHSFISTGNSGMIYRIKPTLGRESYYISKVLDTLFTSAWGNFTIRESGKLSKEFRTGNTIEPDGAWTEWMSACSESECSIKNSPARFIQYKVTFVDLTDSFFSDTRLAYHTKNQKPIIRFVKINGDEKKKKEPKGQNENPKNEMSGYAFPVIRIERTQKVIEPHSALKEIIWDAFDYDQDLLSYDLFYSAVDEGEWKKVFQAEDLLQTNFLWNTESIPSGMYSIKLIAKDNFDNTKEETKSTAKISARFLIDNEAPRFEKVETKGSLIKGKVLDAFSRILQIDYSIDGLEWSMIRPSDGLYDERTEEFSLGVKLPKGSHSISLRAFDEESNLISQHIRIKND